MGFRPGQKVRIAKNLGLKSTHEANEYYYGGDIQSVKLGQIATVDYIAASNRISLRLKNGDSWYVHPKEISLPKQVLTDPSLKKLERHPLFELAEQSPVIVIGGQVYSCGDFKSEDSFIDQTGTRAGLAVVGELKSLDELAYHRNENLLNESRQRYREQLITQMGLGGKTETDLNLPQFIYSKVFCHLRERGEYSSKIGEILGSKEQEVTKTEIPLRNLEAVASKITRDLIKIRRDIESESRERDLFKDGINRFLKQDYRTCGDKDDFHARFNGDFAIAGGEVYAVTPANKGITPEVMLAGKKYTLKKIGKTKQVEIKYTLEVSRVMRLQTLEKDLDKKTVLELLKKDTSVLTAIAGLEKYDEGKFGFLRDQNEGDAYFVYIRVPSFGIKCSDKEVIDRAGEYFIFEDSYIGTYVEQRGKKFDFNSEIFRLKVKENISEIGDMCVGEIKLPVSGKDKGQIIAQRLRKMKNIILLANSRDWYLATCEYDDCSLEDIKRRKLKIVNALQTPNKEDND